jgi:hypothetical protein
MGGQMHLVGLTGDGCRIARDGAGGYVVHHDQVEGAWQRVANLPAAYAACELFSQRDAIALPRWRQQA